MSRLSIRAPFWLNRRVGFLRVAFRRVRTFGVVMMQLGIEVSSDGSTLSKTFSHLTQRYVTDCGLGGRRRGVFAQYLQADSTPVAIAARYGRGGPEPTSPNCRLARDRLGPSLI